MVKQTRPLFKDWGASKVKRSMETGEPWLRLLAAERAAYERGLEDAAKVCDQVSFCVNDERATAYLQAAIAIRALKHREE